ncbi:MAG: hypothetical protein WCK13_12310 [Ignavibacteriota bacterium]
MQEIFCDTGQQPVFEEAAQTTGKLRGVEVKPGRIFSTDSAVEISKDRGVIMES